LVFDIDEILAENKRHTFADKNSTSKILKQKKSEDKENEENEEDSNTLNKPALGKFQKQVSFQVKTIHQKFSELKNEYIYFNIYEYYDQGEEIFLCSTKITIGEIMKRTNRFLFNLLINDKKLGQLKIGKIN
jgi:ABC-type microcin C transport system permease subunit YejB